MTDNKNKEEEDLPKLNCVHCKKHIERDSEDHDNVHINENDNIICDDCLDKCDCEDCLHECGETGGRRGGGCGKKFNYNDGIMIDNTSYCISCGEKEEEEEEEEEEVFDNDKLKKYNVV